MFIFIFLLKLFGENPQEYRVIKWYGEFKEQATLTGSWGGGRTWLEQRGVTPFLTLNGSLGRIIDDFQLSGRALPYRSDLGVEVDTFGVGLWSNGRLKAGLELRHSMLSNNSITTHFGGFYQSLNTVENTDNYLNMGEVYYEQRLPSLRGGVRFGRLYAGELFLNQNAPREFANSSFYAPAAVPLPRFPTTDPTFFTYAPHTIRQQFAPSLAAVFWANILPWFKLTAGVMDPFPSEHLLFLSNEAKQGNGLLAMIEGQICWGRGWGLPGGVIMGWWYLRHPEGLQRYEAPLPKWSYHLKGVIGAYLSLEQMVYREKSKLKNSEGLYLFAQAGWSPHLWDVAWQVTTGILYQGIIPYRPNDILGLGFSAAGFSEQLSLPMAVIGDVNNGGWEMSGSEVVMEIFYKRIWSRFLTLQNGFQYIINPRGITIPHSTLSQKSVLAYSLRIELHF